jgi:hypothetical protein
MLLAHNLTLSPDRVPALSREEFAEIFRSSLQAHPVIQTKLLHHPHWTVEILFPTASFAPQRVGELCAQALAQYRRSQVTSAEMPEILVLGGIKTTPPTSNAPEALQPGDWGVDVVETQSSEAFLQAIAWEATIAQKSADSIFKVESKDA